MVERYARGILAAGALLGFAACGQRAVAAEPFTLSSPAFADNGIMDPRNGGNDKSNPNCLGQNVSPPLEWSHPPDGTKSFAFLMFDPQGGFGLGISHEVSYGIPATTTSFKEGELTAGRGFVGGKGSAASTVYFGPCPPPGTGLHHYIFSIIATDLEPAALVPGLNRDQLLTELRGHARAAAVMIGRLGAPR